jgi:phage gpG-like protein
MRDATARVGIVEAQNYPDGTPVAYVAAIHEYGSPKNNIPMRPFFRPTIKKNQTNWTAILTKGAKAVFNGKESIGSVLDKVASLAAGQIRQAISEIKSPPLKAATIANKLRKYKDQSTVGNLNKPLVDSGVLLNSITHVVIEK